MNPTLLERTLELAVAIQQIPAPTFEEARRAAFIHQRFLQEGFTDVHTDPVGNVYARLPGLGKAPPLVVTAHLDTVFPAATELQLQRQEGRILGPGIGDNSIGLAGLFALGWALRAPEGGFTDIPGDIWLVANVGEEGLGNLHGMRAVVERFGGDVTAYLVLEGMALGQVYHRGLGVRRYQITAETAGGHSWIDYGKPSAIHELAKLIHRITELPLTTEPRTTLNVGVISGGSSVNSIAARATCLLDLRSEESDALELLEASLAALIRDANREGVRVAAEVVGERPAGALPLSHRLVQLGVRCLEAHGIRARPNIGSTDANLPLSRGFPAICLGLTTGGGAHTLQEWIDTQPLRQGLAQLIDFVRLAFA